MNDDDVKHEGTKSTKDHEEGARVGAGVRRLTGKGVGAIGVVGIFGEEAREVVGRMVRSKRVGEMAVGSVVRTDVLDLEGRVVDDVVVVRVGEEGFEVHCHGGVAVVEGVLRRAVEVGAVLREGGGGGILGEVEIVLGRVLTMTGARVVAAQMEEGLMGWAMKWGVWLEGKSENDLWRMQSEVQWVLERSGVLRRLVEGVRVAIVGPPNAGKSTLANALIGRAVSITSEVAGTTRDWVEAGVVFVCGEVRVPVVLVDTAGVRETGDVLEREAIVRTGMQVAEAEVVVVVRDASQEEGSGVWDLGSVSRAVLVGNKVDLGRVGLEEGMIEVSAKNGTGLDELMEAVVREVGLEKIGEGEVFAFCERQVGILEELALVGGVEEARGLLGRLIHG